MELIDLYNQYRQEEIRIVNEKIFKTLDKAILLNAARVLEMTDKDDNIIFTDENQMGALMDFAIHEMRIDGQNAVDRYIEKYGAENETEEKVLNALKSSYTSLYRVVNVSEGKNMLFLKNILKETRNTRLIDISLSQISDPNILIFTRLLPFPELNMTSGASFVYTDELEISITSLYKKTIGQVQEDIEANKYVIFYSLYKQYGLNMNYNNADDHECQDENCEHEHHHHHHHH
ncbi:MAG: hypothetical protein K0R09_1094 [Clostridiales bacterium]|jgi:hypothetical protein|nr:hypothetical protein [Clostridiales bacterium]